jgi:Mg-chelatase subunit ChlD
MHPRNKLTALLLALALGSIALAPILRAESAPSRAPSRSQLRGDVEAPPALAAVQQPPASPSPPQDPPAPAVSAPAAPAAARRDVDVVLIIDTSGSMDGLLDSARARLWDIVNDVAERDRDAHLRVAVLAYGTPHYGENNGYVKILTDLSDDLDGIYGHAMSLRTDGGEEYVGWATHTALEKLSWSKQRDAARIVFVAGNEGAGQGPLDFRTVCAQARERKIVVNALYAGSREQGIGERWEELAQACGGVYTHIDTQQSVAQIAAPQDQRLQLLNQQLNATYVGYGERGEEGCAAQVQADVSSSGMGSSTMASRIVSKGNAVYDNRSWDLVDAVRTGTVDVAKLPEEQLPADLRAMSPEQRKARLSKLEADRQRIQAEILRLASERDTFLKGARSQGQQHSLDVATESMLDAQLK